MKKTLSLLLAAVCPSLFLGIFHNICGLIYSFCSSCTAFRTLRLLSLYGLLFLYHTSLCLYGHHT